MRGSGSSRRSSVLVRHAGLPYRLFAPSGPLRRPPVVLVHGLSGDPMYQFRSFLPFAARHGVPLITPEFRRPEFAGYQRLGSRRGALGAAQALDDVITDVAGLLDAPLDMVDLVGFSAGAQFAHRYAMIFPHRVRRLVVASAGWYTYLDITRRFPHGAAPSDASGGLPVEIDRFLTLPMQVMVGDRDGERDIHLRSNPRIDREQGLNRLVRARRWVEHLSSEARDRDVPHGVALELLPRTGHSFRQAMTRARFGQRVFAFLHSPARLPGGVESTLSSLNGGSS